MLQLWTRFFSHWLVSLLLLPVSFPVRSEADSLNAAGTVSHQMHSISDNDNRLLRKPLTAAFPTGTPCVRACKECEAVLFGVSQVERSEVQMFVLFHKLILHTEGTHSFPLFFILSPSCLFFIHPNTKSHRIYQVYTKENTRILFDSSSSTCAPRHAWLTVLHGQNLRISFSYWDNEVKQRKKKDLENQSTNISIALFADPGMSELFLVLTHYSSPLSPEIGLRWQLNSGRSEIPILWMSYYSSPQ